MSRAWCCLAVPAAWGGSGLHAAHRNVGCSSKGHAWEGGIARHVSQTSMLQSQS